MIGDTLTRSSLETSIQPLLDFVGLSLVGPVTLKLTSISRSNHIIDITITASCARRLDMDPTTAANPTPSPSKPNSQSASSLDSSPSTLLPFQVTLRDSNGRTINYQELDVLKLLLDANGGSLAAEVTQQPNGKLMLTIHKGVSPT